MVVLQQDFAARILADNLSALLSGESETDEALRVGSRANRTYTFRALKPVLAGCLLGIAQAWAALPEPWPPSPAVDAASSPAERASIIRPPWPG